MMCKAEQARDSVQMQMQMEMEMNLTVDSLACACSWPCNGSALALCDEHEALFDVASYLWTYAMHADADANANANASANETAAATTGAELELALELEAHSELIPASLQAAYRVFFAYFATIWCTLSVLSNAATIAVLNHKSMKSTTNFLLTAVACSNVVIGSLYLLFASYFYIARNGEMNTLSHFMATVLWLLVPAMLCAHMIQMWMTVAVTMFRLLFVRYAHRSQQLCNTRRARGTLVGVTLGCMVLCIPCLVGHKVMLCSDAYPPERYANVCGPGGEPNATSLFYTVHIEKETDGQLAIFKTMLLWVNSVIAKFIPAVMLCGLSAMLISTMKDADKRRHHLRLRPERRSSSSKPLSDSSDERDKKTNRTTRLLVVIAIMFIITYLPQSVLELVGSFTEVVRVEVGDKLGDVTDTLSLLNSGMTFFLYCFMSQQFRTVFSQVFIQPVTRVCDPKRSPAANRVLSVHSQQRFSLSQATVTTKCNSFAVTAMDEKEKKSAAARGDDCEAHENNNNNNNNSEASRSVNNGGAAKKQLQVTVAACPAETANDKVHFV